MIVSKTASKKWVNWLKKLSFGKITIVTFCLIGYNVLFIKLSPEIYIHWLVFGLNSIIAIIWGIIALISTHMAACEADQRMPDGRYTNRDSF